MADKLRFFEIGKANTEIARLEALVADRDAALTAAQDKITALESAPKPDVDAQLKADLVTAKQTIGTLEASVVAKDGEITALKTKLTETEKSVADKASAAALNIVAGMGAPPVVTAPNPNPQSETPAAAKNLTQRCLEANAANQPK